MPPLPSSRRRLAGLRLVPLALLTALALACTGEDPPIVPGGDGPDGGGGEGDGAVDRAPGVPAHGAASASYFDGDLREGFLGSDIVIQRAADEADITEYRVYFGASPEKKLVASPLVAVPATGADRVVPVPAGTAMPAASHLLVYAANADGEHATPVAIPLIDNFVRAAPLTVGATPIDWLDTSLAYDRKNRRVVLAGATRGSPSARVLLCEPGFTACQAKDASAGRSTTEFSRHLQVLVDEAGDKLLVFQTYPTGLDKTKPALSRCNLDGTACEAIDLSVGQTGTAGENFNAAIDPVGKRFYVATTNLAAGQLGLVRCALDGTGCVYKDAGAAASAPAPNVHPNVAVDRASMRIGIVSRDAAVETTERRLHLTTCDLDGDACATVRAHALQPPQSGLFPRAVFDARTGTMLTVARNDANGGRASLYRCGVGSRLCSHADVSAGAAEQSTTNRAAVALFPDRDALFFVTFGNAGGGSGYQLSLYRCRSDGSDCTARLLSQTGRYGGEPTMVIDPDSKAMYVAAEESATRQVVGFSLRAW